MKKEKQLLGNMGLYMIGNFGSKILIMLIVPIYTYFVSPEEIGYYDLVTTAINLLCPIIMLSIQEGAYRWLLHSSVDPNTIIKNCLIVLNVGFAIGLGAFVIIYNTQDTHLPYMGLVVLLCLLQSIYILIQEITRGLRHIKLFSVSGIVYSMVFFIATILFVCIWKLKLQGMLLALLTALIVTNLVLIISQKEICQVFHKKNEKFKVHFQMIKYSVLLLPNNISWWITSYADRFMIRALLGMGANGIYAVATKFPSMLSMVTSVFYSAWQEQAILYYKDKDRDAYYSKIFNIYASLLLSGTLLLIPVTKIFIKVTMTSEYHSAALFVGFLYLGSVFQAFSAFYGTGYLSACKTNGAMITTIVGAILNILINAWFMGKFGLQIAGISTWVSYMIVWLIRIIHTRQYFRIRLQKGRLSFILIANLLCILGTFNTNNIMDAFVFIGALLIVIIYNKQLVIQGITLIKSRRKSKNHEA